MPFNPHLQHINSEALYHRWPTRLMPITLPYQHQRYNIGLSRPIPLIISITPFDYLFFMGWVKSLGVGMPFLTQGHFQAPGETWQVSATPLTLS